MLILLSPAKTLDFETPVKSKSATQPVMLDQSEILIKDLRKLTPHKLSALMKISDKLGELNFERYMDWQTPFTRKNAKQAAMAFQGDVYTGLQAEKFTAEQIKFAQAHLRILSGLYGVLRPMDLIQPYRLEMGTKFKNKKGKDLYEFWGDAIADDLSAQLKKLKSDVILNLASNEYFKAARAKTMDARVVSPVFKDLSKGQYKIISFYAKKARGTMASWVIRKGVTDPAKLKNFKEDGYKYDAESSTPDKPVFLRAVVPGN